MSSLTLPGVSSWLEIAICALSKADCIWVGRVRYVDIGRGCPLCSLEARDCLDDL